MTTLILVLYGVTLIGVGLASFKLHDTMTNYLVAGRNQTKLFVVASMLASTIGGALTVGAVTKTWTMGFPAFWFVAAGAIAHFLQGWLLSEKVRQTEALTLSDLADKLVGRSVRRLTSVIVVITWVGIATAQFVTMAGIVAGATTLSFEVALLISVAFLVVYTLLGGQKSVIRTDLYQFIILALALIFTAIWLFTKHNDGNLAIDIHLFSASFQPQDFLYYLVVVGGSYFVCPMMFTRMLSADSAKTARRSSFLSGAGMLVFAVVITAIGLWAKAVITPDALGSAKPLNFIMANYLPAAGGIILMLGLLSAILSTADTVLLTAAGTLQKDIIGRDSVPLVRVWVVVISIVAAVIALFYRDIIGIILKTYNGYTAGIVPALFVAIMYAGKKRPNELLIFAAIAVGYGLGLAGSFLPVDSTGGQLLPLFGLGASALLSILAILIGPAKRQTAAA
ncbi:MAG: hypothetical protein A2087_01440 [Spirochaetes bacterium GWD1_61_31]|nr:MAG: hypothetical protein A2Y37_04360 [Spirochaetes bacterium GWB1_60_80]OHD36901.1 MAG: hypothetical protein A2087_01440 [Spirochaetes bacterium GWD1_61_31]OHD42633.1 MAG: hypothetical protein A2Y35_07660 [Spirochaetes bacterium GWE1_60_18]